MQEQISRQNAEEVKSNKAPQIEVEQVEEEMKEDIEGEEQKNTYQATFEEVKTVVAIS